MSNGSFPPLSFGPSNTPNPYGAPPPAPSSSGSSALKWILGILAVALIGGLALCCGGPMALVYVGKQSLGPQMLPQVQANAKIREHLGEVHSCEWDFTATANDEGAETMVYNLQGSKGTGVLIAETESTDDGEQMVSGILRLPDGREIPVVDPPHDEIPLSNE
ncbi:MAG: hypothetical protein U0939_24205 [Pirellulales bacterium]